MPKGTHPWDSRDPKVSSTSSYAYDDLTHPMEIKSNEYKTSQKTKLSVSVLASAPYPDDHEYPNTTKWDWEEDHIYSMYGCDSKDVTLTEKDKTLENSETHIRAKEKDMWKLCDANNKNIKLVFPHLEELVTAEWFNRPPFVFQREKINFDLKDAIPAYFYASIYYSSDKFKFQILKIDMVSICLLPNFLYHLLQFFSPQDLNLTVPSISGTQFTKELKNSFGLSYIPQISETLREKLFLCWRNPASPKEDLQEFFPIIMNYIFAMKVLKKVMKDFGRPELEFQNNKDEFDIICKNLFSSDFFTDTMDYNEIFDKEDSNLLPNEILKIVSGYLSRSDNQYEILLRTQAIDLLEKKTKIPRPKNGSVTEHLNIIFTSLKEQKILEGDYRLIGPNTAYSKKDKGIVPYNGYGVELNYGDICKLFEYLGHEISIPMYKLGTLQKKATTLNKVFTFFCSSTAKAEKAKVEQELIQLSSGMKNHPYEYHRLGGK